MAWIFWGAESGTESAWITASSPFLSTTAVMHAVFGLPGTGKMFVPLGDVFHLAEDGPELLMGFPRTPFVAGA